jgi:uncharacterized membrane protein YqjE
MGKLEPAAFESLENLGHGLVTQLRGRLELFAVEITEEEIRFARILGWQLLALFLTCLTLTLATVLVLATFWDTEHRVEAITWTLFGTAAASGAAWWVHRRHLRRKPIVFMQTIEELRRDALALARQAPPPGPVP